jgi:hypothetical protein
MFNPVTQQWFSIRGGTSVRVPGGREYPPAGGPSQRRPPQRQAPLASRPTPQRAALPVQPRRAPVRPAATAPPPRRNLPVVRRGGGGTLVPAGPARQTGVQQTPVVQTAPGYAGLTDPTQQAFIDASINPALQQIQYEQEQQRQEDAQRAAAIANFTQQFLGQVGQVPGQVQQDYGQMLSQQAELGSQAQQALTAANPNAGIQQDLSAINAPAAQQAQVANKLGQAFTGGGAVLEGTGAYIPGNRISRDEAAQVAYERGLPAITASRGAGIYNQLLTRSQQAQSDLAQQAAQVEARVPGLQLQYQSNLASNAAKQQQLALERAALGLKAQGQGFNQAATQARIGISQGQLQLGKARLDQQTQISLANLGLRQQSQQLQVAKAIQRQSAQRRWLGLSPALYSKKMADAAGAAQAMRLGTNDPKTGVTHPPLSWGDAIQEMNAEGIPTAMAIPILAHVYAPGVAGRPAKGVWALLASYGLNYAATPTGVWYPGSRKNPNRPPR